MSTRCRRMWEVEAARDGRLSGRALHRFEEHVRTCRVCAAEQRTLETLMQALAEPVTFDEVSLRRERDRLLEAADAMIRRPAPVERGWLSAAAAAIVVALLLSTWALFSKTASHPTEPTLTVSPEPGARWDRRRNGTTDQVNLVDGALQIVVRRSASDPKVSVHVPDGDIDDLGTVFRVAVREGRTMEIVVREGSVVFRRPGRAATVVAGGTSFRPDPLDAPALTVVAAPTSDRSMMAPVAATPRRVAVAPRHAIPRSNPTEAKAPAATADPAEEDAVYLRIVALGREHRTSEARAMAAEYLERFPSGFRRAEVLKFVLSQH